MPNVVVNGVTVSYGPVKSTHRFASMDMRTDNLEKFIRCHFTWDNLPNGAATGGRNLSGGPIPSGSIILDAYWQTVVPFNTGLTFDVGISDAEGNNVNYQDPTGAAATSAGDELFDGLATAQINAYQENAAASVHSGTNSGVLCAYQVDRAASAASPVLLEAGYIKIVAASGTPSAGEGILIVKYVRPHFKFT